MDGRVEDPLRLRKGDRVRVAGRYWASKYERRSHTKRVCIADCLLTTPAGVRYRVRRAWVRRADRVVNLRLSRRDEVTFTASVVPCNRSRRTPPGRDRVAGTAWLLTSPGPVEFLNGNGPASTAAAGRLPSG